MFNVKILKNKLMQNLFLNSIITKIVLVLFSLLNTVLINRALGVTLRGEYAYIINISNILQLILNMGIGYSYTYFKKNKSENIKMNFSLIIFLQFIFYVFLYICINFFVININFKYIGLLSIVQTLNIQILFITMIEDIKKRNKIIKITSMLYTISLLIIFYNEQRDLEVIIIITIFRYLLECFLLSFTFGLYRINFKQIKHHITFKFLKKILSIGLPVMIMTLLITFNYNIDIVIMKHLLPISEVGLYGVGVTLANMLWIIPDAFKEVIFNQSTKSDKTDNIIYSLIINILVSIIIIIGFIFLGKIFINTLYGIEFSQAYNVSVILFFGTIPMLFYKLIHPIYITNGKQNIVTLILSISVISNIFLNFILIPFYGIMGAAIATVVSYSVCGIIFVFKFKNDYNIDFSIYIVKIIQLIRMRLK
jgi:O-antigen/teichoic acid export membrane protein